MRPILCALLASLLFLGTAAAHTTDTTDDGRYFVTVGNQNEPITTYVKTGLDLILRHNNSGERGDEVPDQELSLQVTLESPSGETMTMALRPQHGSVGRYQFESPYILTEPGEYYAHVIGSVEGSPIDKRILVGSGPVPDWSAHTFPAQLDTPQAMQGEMAALQATVADLQSQVASLSAQLDGMSSGQGGPDESASNDAPGLGLVALLVAIIAFAWTRR